MASCTYASASQNVKASSARPLTGLANVVSGIEIGFQFGTSAAQSGTFPR